MTDTEFAEFKDRLAERQHSHTLHRAWLLTDEGRAYTRHRLANAPECQAWREADERNLIRVAGEEAFLTWARMSHQERMAVDEDYRARTRRFIGEAGSKDGEFVRRCKAALKRIRAQAKKYGYMSCHASLEELVAAYTGYCQLCDITEKELCSQFALHHNHSTGRFEGWLCSKCNIFIG